MWWLVGLLGCASQVQLVELEVNGITRSYYEHVPDTLPAEPATMLVLHGGGTTSSRMGRRMGQFTGFSERADAGNYLAVFPNSQRGNWNDGRTGQGAEHIDDLAYFDALLDDLSRRHGIDRSRVGLAGISNGGFMTVRLLCERTEDYAGGVSVAATQPSALRCKSGEPVTIGWMVGTDDKAVPYEGGQVLGNRGRIKAAEQARDQWVARNGCTGEPRVRAVPDRDPSDHSTAEFQVWSDCAGGTKVGFVRLDGAGHTWPGGSQYLPRFLVGEVNRDLDGARWIEGFLEF